MCVNLYPFERVASRRGADDAEVIENIDIGGPTLIRAAAKNYPFAAVVVRPESYDAILDELGRREGRLSEPTREALATEAFSYTARYDAAISRWFSEKEESFPGLYVRAYEKVLDLSYGENPHQRAAYYAQAASRTDLLSMVSKLHGKELSFNNLLDLDSGRKLLEEFEVPAATILKHNNPCGTAVGKNAIDAYDRALACDPLSAYGGVIGFNRRVDSRAGGAPERHLRGARVRTRVRRGRVRGPRPEAQHPHPRGPGAPARARLGDHDMRRVRGGILVQDRDSETESRDEMSVATEVRPTEEQWGDLLFAWRVCKHVRSNAIVLGKGLATVGIGACQMSRVDSVRDRDREGAGPTRGRGDGVRRLLPLCGRP